MSENKDTDKALVTEGERLKEEINNDDLYNALMAGLTGLTEKQQLEIVMGIQSYLNHSNEQEMLLKVNILKTLTPREDEKDKTYIKRMKKFLSDPKSFLENTKSLNGGSKKKKRKTQKKRKRNKRRKSNKKRRSRKSKKKKSRSRRRR